MPIHDWTIEETLSALVMQAELLLISRNMTLVSAMLPLFLRTSNLLESRRDSTTNMFLTGLVCIFRTMPVHALAFVPPLSPLRPLVFVCFSPCHPHCSRWHPVLPISSWAPNTTGVASNLLAPSFGAWRLPSGRRAWAYMCGISVTYTAALNR